MPGWTKKQMAGVRKVSPEYMTFSCQYLYGSTSATWVFGGHGFGGGGVGVPKGCGCYLALGILDGPTPHTPREVDRFVNGQSATLGAYFIVGGGKTTASGMNSTERGVGFGWGTGASHMDPSGRGQDGRRSCPNDSCYDEKGYAK